MKRSPSGASSPSPMCGTPAPPLVCFAAAPLFNPIGRRAFGGRRLLMAQALCKALPPAIGLAAGRCRRQYDRSGFPWLCCRFYSSGNLPCIQYCRHLCRDGGGPAGFAGFEKASKTAKEGKRDEKSTLKLGKKPQAGARPVFSRSAAGIVPQPLAGADSRRFCATGGNRGEPGYKVRCGESVTVEIPPPESMALKRQNMGLDIVYEDDDLAIVNKPRGLVVHPAPGNRDTTLVNGLLEQLTDLSGINGHLRPGIVHRIDKDTSGLLLVAKNDFAHLALAEQIRVHGVARVYEAIVDGVMAEPAGLVDCPIGRHPVERKKWRLPIKTPAPPAPITGSWSGLKAIPMWRPKLETGRTHQIRVHMRYIGHPLLGDPLYGKGGKTLLPIWPGPPCQNHCLSPSPQRGTDGL